jgi:hypothetical protein
MYPLIPASPLVAPDRPSRWQDDFVMLIRLCRSPGRTHWPRVGMGYQL